MAGAITPATKTPAGTSAVTKPLIPTMGDTQHLDSNALQLVVDVFGIVAMPLPVHTPLIAWQFDAPVSITYKPAADDTSEYLYIRWKDSQFGEMVVPIKTTIASDIVIEFKIHPMTQAVNGGPGWRAIMLQEAQTVHADTPIHKKLMDPCVIENRVQMVTWHPRTDVCSAVCVENLKDDEFGALVGAYGGKMWVVRAQGEVNRARLRLALIQEEEASLQALQSSEAKPTVKKEDKRRTERVVRQWTKLITITITRQLVRAIRKMTTYRIHNPVFPQDMFALHGNTVADMLYNRWQVAAAQYTPISVSPHSI